MWKILLSFVTSPITSISNDLKEAYAAKLAAQNDAERLSADERINLLEARKSVILAAQSDPLERLVRVGLAVPVIAYSWKLILWDKVFGLGVTDGLSPELWQFFWIVVSGYFIDATVRGTARILKR